MVAEATKLVATHALVEAREHELKMAVQVAFALKAEQDEEQARLRAERDANEELLHKDQDLERLPVRRT